MVWRLTKKEEKKKRRDGSGGESGNLDTVLALVYESGNLGDSVVLSADETPSPFS